MATRPRPAGSFYSYSARKNLRQEEIAAYRRIALATVIIVALLVGGYFLGVPILAHLGDNNSIPTQANTPLGSTDNIPPASPKIDGLPDAVRTRTIPISGSAESGSTVTVKVNDQTSLTTLTDKQGLFNGNITLKGGANSITATAKDPAGNTSRASKPVTVTYDATPPSVTVSSPANNATVSSSPVTIGGTTDPQTTVAVNDRQAIVQADGTFSVTVDLQPGANTITITATDPAGNTTKLTRTVNFAAPSQSTPSATPQQ